MTADRLALNVELYNRKHGKHADFVPTVKQIVSYIEQLRNNEGKSFIWDLSPKPTVKAQEKISTDNAMSPELKEILNLFKEAGIEFTTDNEWAKQVVDEAKRMVEPFGPNKPYYNKKKASAATRMEIRKIVSKNAYEKPGTDLVLADGKLFLIDHSSDEEFQ